MAHATQMSAADTALLVIDVQEKLLPFIPDAAALMRNMAFLIDGARLLDMPVLATEQYPRGLGATVPELAQRLPVRPEKVAFSSCAVPAVVEELHREARPKVVLAGIETHVCVLHTALDLLALDFRVFMAVDAVGRPLPHRPRHRPAPTGTGRGRADHGGGLRLRVDRRGGPSAVQGD